MTVGESVVFLDGFQIRLGCDEGFGFILVWRDGGDDFHVHWILGFPVGESVQQRDVEVVLETDGLGLVSVGSLVDGHHIIWDVHVLFDGFVPSESFLSVRTDVCQITEVHQKFVLERVF